MGLGDSVAVFFRKWESNWGKRPKDWKGNDGVLYLLTLALFGVYEGVVRSDSIKRSIAPHIGLES